MTVEILGRVAPTYPSKFQRLFSSQRKVVSNGYGITESVTFQKDVVVAYI